MGKRKIGIENAFKAGLWYSLSAIVAKSISVITTPIFTRIMSVADYGVTATFSSWYSILLVICTANLTYSHSQAKNDFSGKFDEYVGATHVLSFMITFVLWSICACFIKPVVAFTNMNELLIMLLFVYLFTGGTVLITQSENRYTYAYQKNVFITFFVTVGTVVFTFLCLFFIKTERYYARILGIVIPSIILAAQIIIRDIKRKVFNVNLEYWKYGLKISIPLIFHTLSLNLLTQSDRIIITEFCGSDAAGVYSLIYQYAMLINIILNAINESWNPWFHDIYHKGKQNYELINKKMIPLNAFVAYICMGCIAVGPEAVWILGGEKYSVGIDCIIPIVLGLMAQFLFSHYIILEIHHKQTQYTSIGTFIAAVVNVVLNILFVPQYGFVCAAYTTLISYLLLYIIHMIIVRKKLNIKLYDDSKIVVWLFVVAIFAVICRYLYSYIILRYVLLICVTIMLGIHMKDELTRIVGKKQNGSN